MAGIASKEKTIGKFERYRNGSRRRRALFTRTG
jgi:hypothetical protein